MSGVNEPPTAPDGSWNWGNSESPANGYGQFSSGSWQNPAGSPSTGQGNDSTAFPSPESTPSPLPGDPNISAPRPGSTKSNPYFDQYALNFQQVQPGIIPLRPLTLGDIFNGTFLAMRQAPSVMFGLILSIWAVFSIISGAFAALTFPDLTVMEQRFEGTVDTSALLKLFSELVQGGIISLVPSLIIQLAASAVTTGIAITAIAPMVLGRRLSVTETWQETKPHLLSMIGYAFLYVLISFAIYTFAFLPLLLLIPGAVNGDFGMILTSLGLTVLTMIGALIIWAFVYIRLLFVYPAMVMENLTLSKAMSRSWHLAKGSFWRVFGIMLLAIVIQNAILTGLTFVLQLISGGVAAATVVVGANAYAISIGISIVVGFLITGVFIPFFSGIQSLLYIDVRMRREGLALNLLHAAQQN